VGRTGTLITIQSMMQMMNEEGKIDIFNFVLDMRRRRNYMVQTEVGGGREGRGRGGREGGGRKEELQIETCLTHAASVYLHS